MPGDPVVIVGGGNSAGQAATWLADHGAPGHGRHPRSGSDREHVTVPA